MTAKSQSKEPNLVTPGVIAQELHEPIHRVLYILSTRPEIKPVARAGRIRLYSISAIEQVRRERILIQEFRRSTREGGEA